MFSGRIPISFKRPVAPSFRVNLGCGDIQAKSGSNPLRPGVEMALDEGTTVPWLLFRNDPGLPRSRVLSPCFLSGSGLLFL